MSDTQGDETFSDTERRLRQKLEDCEKLRDSWMEQAQIWQQKHAVAVTVADTQIRLAKRVKTEALEEVRDLVEFHLDGTDEELRKAREIYDAIVALKDQPC